MKHDERVALRKAKLNRQADHLEKAAKEASEKSDQIASRITPGQPILIGHHSEKRHRRDLERMGNLTRKSIETKEIAKEKRELANCVGYAISSADEDAIELLNQKLQQLLNKRQKYKEANKLIKKHDFEGVKALGFDDYDVELFKQPDYKGTIRLPSFYLTNLNAQIRSVNQRIKSLEARGEIMKKILPVIRENVTLKVDDERIQFVFNAIPSEEIRKELKRSGYKWSPSRYAWVRLFNSSAYIIAKALLDEIAPTTSSKL